MTTSLERRQVRIQDGTELSSRVGGRGAPVLLVHGFSGSAEAWPEALIEGLLGHFRVVAVDLVGHGGSARPTDPDRYRIDRVVADLVAVQDALVGSPAAWIGYSMGGRVALAAALLAASSVSALVLEGATPGLVDPEVRARRRSSDAARAAALDAGGIGAFVDDWLAQPLFATQRSLPASVRRRQREGRLAQDPRALAACLKGLGSGSQPPYWDALDEVSVPTLLVTGGRDTKFCEVASAMEARMPHARHKVVPGVGHAVHLEATSAWLEVALPFLADLPPAARGS